MHDHQGRLGISLTMECTISSKPGKICFAFDCSAEYQGRSMKKHLPLGSELRNKIIGVLTRFREGKIAFTADVKTMYYQVQVIKDQQSFLKFLWWENHDIDRGPS